MVRNGSATSSVRKTIVNGLRTGNNFTTGGQQIDRLAFVVHRASYPGPAARSERGWSKPSRPWQCRDEEDRRSTVDGCATMGEKLVGTALAYGHRRGHRGA